MIELGIFAQKGVKVSHNKRTSKMEAVRIDHCERVTLLMKQHIGAACIPCVAPGDRVLAGQVVGDTSFEPSAPVHASISGTVQDIELIRLPSGEMSKLLWLNLTAGWNISNMRRQWSIRRRNSLWQCGLLAW